MYSNLSSARREHEANSANRHRLTRIDVVPNRVEVALSVEALSKRSGDVDAVSQVSFEVRQGEVFGLLGLNGAGKTTLISILATERHPSAGDARMLGRSIKDEVFAVRRMLGVAPQEVALYPLLTAAENLRFFGRIYKLAFRKPGPIASTESIRVANPSSIASLRPGHGADQSRRAAAPFSSD